MTRIFNQTKSLTITLCILFFLGALVLVYINNSERICWGWINWKLAHPMNAGQKAISEYFKATDGILEAAVATENESGSCLGEDCDVDKAIVFVDQSLENAKKMTVPLLCQNYHNLIIGILESIKQNLQNRILFEAEKIDESILREVRLKQLRLENSRNKEFFKITREAGFVRFW